MSHHNDHHAPASAVDVDPAALADAQHLWAAFVHYSKYGIAAVVVILALMALFLL
jgi:hypothetical protein